MKIPFYKYYLTGNEVKYIQDVLENHLIISGDGPYTKKVHELLEKKYGTKKALLTTSGTTALEMAVRLLDISDGDEIIVPSFTFSSTVNAILLAGGIKAVFADIDPNTLNISIDEIKKKITPRTKALMIVHYAGISCDMDEVLRIAKEYNLKVIEDAAQGIESKYKGKYLGTIGDIGCISFHETKNITSGEGGALFINRGEEKLFEKAEIMREKGTNRTKFFQGQVDKYTWVDLGSSYLPSDILSAFLYAQLEQVEKIISLRKTVYNNFYQALISYQEKGIVKLPTIPDYMEHNAHIFYILCNTEDERNKLLNYLKLNTIGATFHYIPLHSAPHGKKLGNKVEDCPITEDLSKRLIRLPLFSQMTHEEQQYVIDKVQYGLDNLNTI